MPEQTIIAERAAETQQLINYLLDAEPEAILTYADMSKTCGRDVQGTGRHNLISAIRAIQRDQGHVFETIRTVGVRRARGADFLAIGDQSIGKIHRAAKRGAQKLARADFDSLDNTQRNALMSRQAVVGTLHLMSGARGLKQIEQCAAEAQGKVAFSDVARIFAKE